MPTRITTWNLQGRERPDLEVVAAVVRELRTDLLAVQELPRGQAQALSRLLGWPVTWRFKHWSMAVPPEGMALLSPRQVSDVGVVHLARSLQVWSWRRRIAIRARLGTPDGALPLVVAHLGAGVTGAERVRQAALSVGALRPAGGCILGDLNTAPGSAVLAAYEAAGYRDAWAALHPDDPGATNWRPGPRDGAPTQRIDYVLVGPDLDVLAAEVPAVGDPGFERFGALSDHLPLTVTVGRRDGAPA